jgi:hypothetical protein
MPETPCSILTLGNAGYSTFGGVLSGAIQNSKHGGHNLALGFFQQLGANAVTE